MAGGVNLAHAVSPDAWDWQDQTAQLADAHPAADGVEGAPGRDSVPDSPAGMADADGPSGAGGVLGIGTLAAVKDSGEAAPGQASDRQVENGALVHADLDRRPEDRPKIRPLKPTKRPGASKPKSRSKLSGSAYVTRLAAAPAVRADVLCNDLDYLKRRLQNKGVRMKGVKIELLRHHDRTRKARFIMARSGSQATLRAFSAEVSDLRANNVRLPLVADPGELESANLYRKCACKSGKARCP